MFTCKLGMKIEEAQSKDVWKRFYQKSFDAWLRNPGYTEEIYDCKVRNQLVKLLYKLMFK